MGRLEAHHQAGQNCQLELTARAYELPHELNES